LGRLIRKLIVPQSNPDRASSKFEPIELFESKTGGGGVPVLDETVAAGTTCVVLFLELDLLDFAKGGKDRFDVVFG
jgi:hypothetical protein